MIPTPDAQGERLRYPVGASAHSGHSASNRLQIGCPPGPWKESGLVFTTAVGTQMDPANVCRDLRRALSWCRAGSQRIGRPAASLNVRFHNRSRP